LFEVTHIEYGIFEAVPKGISMGVDRLVSYVSSLKYLFTKEGAKSVGGFAAIGDLFPDQWNWYTFWSLTAFLSIMLAFLNILPIPALDGGHVIFVLWEIITRRKPSDKVLEYAQWVGMFLLLALLIFANGNDIYKIFFK
jgi:regulator of sigma E protease